MVDALRADPLATLHVLSQVVFQSIVLATVEHAMGHP